MFSRYTLFVIGMLIAASPYIYAFDENIDSKPTIYIQQSESGQFFRIKLDFDPKNNTYDVIQANIDQADLDKLKAAGFQIGILPLQSEEKLINNDGSLKTDNVYPPNNLCSMPANFDITADNQGQVIGNYYCLTTTASNTVSTQWVGFDFYTSPNYEGQATHNIIVPFFKQILHGWGAFFGNNSQDLLHGCGTNMIYTTQIEGWLQLPQPIGSPPIQPGEQRNTWQSMTYNGPNSCGAELHSGGTSANPQPRYRMSIQASTGKWVSYQVEQYPVNEGNPTVVTPWKTLNVLSQTWPKPQGTSNLDSTAQGLFIGSIDGGNDWTIYIRNLSYGWF